MKEQDFNNIISRLKKHHENSCKINSDGVDMINFNEDLYIVIFELLGFYFNSEILEIIEWYLYEYCEGKMQITDPKEDKVLYDLCKDGELWRFVVESMSESSKK